MSQSNLEAVLTYQQSENTIITNEFDKWHLDDLFDRAIDVVRVPGYYF